MHNLYYSAQIANYSPFVQNYLALGQALTRIVLIQLRADAEAKYLFLISAMPRSISAYFAVECYFYLREPIAMM